jgi:hypothetical protein
MARIGRGAPARPYILRSAVRAGAAPTNVTAAAGTATAGGGTSTLAVALTAVSGVATGAGTNVTLGAPRVTAATGLATATGGTAALTAVLTAASGTATAGGGTGTLAATLTAATGAATASGGTVAATRVLTAVTGTATAAGTAPTLTFVFTAATGLATAGGGAATATVVLPKLSTLQDNFNGSPNPAKWDDSSGVVHTAGELHVPTTLYPTPGYSRRTSVGSFDGTATTHQVKFVSWGFDAGTDMEFRVVTSAQEKTVTATNRLFFLMEAGVLYAQAIVGGSTIVNVNTTPGAPVWVRFREDAGTFYWDTSTDGSSWTNFTSVATSSLFDLTNVKSEFWAGNWNGNSTQPDAVFDDLNSVSVNLTAASGTATAGGGTTALTVTVSASTGVASASGGTAALAATVIAATGTATAAGGTTAFAITLTAAAGAATAAGGTAIASATSGTINVTAATGTSTAAGGAASLTIAVDRLGWHSVTSSDLPRRNRPSDGGWGHSDRDERRGRQRIRWARDRGGWYHKPRGHTVGCIGCRDR